MPEICTSLPPGTTKMLSALHADRFVELATETPGSLT